MALVSFLARPKPRIPFFGLSLLRNPTETLASKLSADSFIQPRPVALVKKINLYFCNPARRSLISELSDCRAKTGHLDIWSSHGNGCQLPGGYSWEFLVRVCYPVLQILTLFQTKKCNFPHPFSDQTSKIHIRFHTWPLGRNCHHYLD